LLSLSYVRPNKRKQRRIHLSDSAKIKKGEERSVEKNREVDSVEIDIHASTSLRSGTFTGDMGDSNQLKRKIDGANKMHHGCGCVTA
jgi:hypothetical protein